MRISDWSSGVCSSDLPADKGLSLGDRLANHITRLTWRTPLHAFRLKGRFPLKLLGVPEDPVPGDTRAGTAIRAGHFLHRGLKLPLTELDFTALAIAPTYADYLRSEEHTSELQSLMRISYAVFFLKKKKHSLNHTILFTYFNLLFI